MIVLVVGLGSMGKRRIRLVKELYPNCSIIGIDNRPDRREETSNQFGIECIDSYSGIKEADCVFICTPPLTHSHLIHECLLKGWNVFTELNLVTEGYEENIALSHEMRKTLFLSSTFLYREETKIIRSKVTKDKRWNYSYHIGQYLPYWHPWESYNDFFLGDKRTNGCREIMAIELPWLIDAFGEVENIHVISNKITDLNIDYDDNFIIQLTHINGNKGSLIVDVVSPIAVRKLEAYAEGAYIYWDGTPDSIKEYDSIRKELVSIKPSEQSEHIDGYSAFIIENAYKNEIREFFDVIEGRTEPKYSFEKDINVLKIIDRIGA